jgi:hypothetical protein
VSAVLALCAVPSAAQGSGQFRYRGSKYAPDALPESAPAGLREMAAFYGPLMKELGLSGYLGSEGDFGLLHTRRLRSAKGLHRTTEKTTELFAKAWGRTVERAPFMVIVLDEQAQVGTVLDHVVPEYPYLAGWAEGARRLSGFNLYDPPLYVVVNDADPKSAFRLVNQVVHQQTLLILYREFRMLPFWVQEGFAWVAEEELTRRIHAFNHRVGFVAVKEHTGWKKGVRALARENDDFERVMSTEPTSYDRELSLLAYGFARYLLAKREDGGRAPLASLGDAWWAKSREGKVPTVRLTREEQAGVLTEVLGEGYDGEVMAFLAGR